MNHHRHVSAQINIKGDEVSENVRIDLGKGVT
jgi:hypothetical protein